MTRHLILVIAATLITQLPQTTWAQQIYKCGNTFSQTPCAHDAKTIDLELSSPPNCGDYSNKDLPYCLQKDKKRKDVQNAEAEKKALDERKRTEAKEAKDNEERLRLKASEPISMKVCRATIAALMGRNIDTIEASSGQDGIIHTSYVRPSDGSTWRNRCRVSEGSVFWATETGRWRTSQDEVISYFLDDEIIMIRQEFPDGSSSDKFYTP